MSTVELTANTIYDRYNLGALPEEVKRQLMILFLTAPTANTEQEPPLLTEEELCERVIRATAEIEDGMAKPIDEFFASAESKYPWLCK